MGREFRIRGMGRTALIAETIHDGISSIAAEIFQRDFDTRRGLAALILGGIKQTLDFLDGLKIKPLRHEITHAHFFFNQTFENGIKHIIGPPDECGGA